MLPGLRACSWPRPCWAAAARRRATEHAACRPHRRGLGAGRRGRARGTANARAARLCGACGVLLSAPATLPAAERLRLGDARRLEQAAGLFSPTPPPPGLALPWAFDDTPESRAPGRTRPTRSISPANRTSASPTRMPGRPRCPAASRAADWRRRLCRGDGKSATPRAACPGRLPGIARSSSDRPPAARAGGSDPERQRVPWLTASRASACQFGGCERGAGVTLALRRRKARAVAGEILRVGRGPTGGPRARRCRRNARAAPAREAATSERDNPAPAPAAARRPGVAAPRRGAWPGAEQYAAGTQRTSRASIPVPRARPRLPAPRPRR